MNPITLDEVGVLISDFGLVDLDRVLADAAKTGDKLNIHYVEHGGDLLKHLQHDDDIPKDEIIDAPFLGDLLICHWELENGSISVLHRKIEEEILSFPFVSNGKEWIPAPMVTHLSRTRCMSKSFLPPRLSKGFGMGVGDWDSDTAKAVLGRLITSSLLLALRTDEKETMQ